MVTCPSSCSKSASVLRSLKKFTRPIILCEYLLCLGVVQEMQWSLSSVMLGRPSPTSVVPAAPTPPVPGSENGVGSNQLGDDANERLKLYADELERILTDAHKQAATFLKKQKGAARQDGCCGEACSHDVLIIVPAETFSPGPGMSSQ